jgi:hypothetical protein
MNRRKFIAAASCSAALVQSTLTVAASSEYTSGTRWIPTKTTLTQPHFYYVAGGISVFVPPEFVAQHGHVYAPIAMTVAPLHDHTDILRGFVLGSNHPLDVLFILADALEGGIALVHDMSSGVTVPQVKLVKINDGNSGSRTFFLSDDFGGTRIFHLTRLDFLSAVCVRHSNYALERSMNALSRRAAGARRDFTPAARWPRIARPAQRGR